MPLRNLLVLIREKPKQDFQFVKVLTLPELLSYIKYFQPVFSSSETSNIARFLLEVNEIGQIDRANWVDRRKRRILLKCPANF